MTNQIQTLLLGKTIPFTESGRDYLIRCLNPEHEDKNPSLRIDKETGAFHCLSCHFKGNIFSHFGAKIDYLDLRRNKLLNLIEDKIRETVGLDIPEGASTLPLKNYRGIKLSTFNSFGAFIHNDYPERLMVPITDGTGRIACFQGRHLSDGKPKYKFYPSHAKVPLFPKVTPIEGSIILVEGLFDMLNLHDKGLTNTICTFGTNSLTPDKVSMLKLQGIRLVVILFDNDEAGHKGAESAKALLNSHDIPAQIYYPKGVNDPGEMTALQVAELKESLYGRTD